MEYTTQSDVYMFGLLHHELLGQDRVVHGQDGARAGAEGAVIQKGDRRIERPGGGFIELHRLQV